MAFHQIFRCCRLSHLFAYLHTFPFTVIWTSLIQVHNIVICRRISYRLNVTYSRSFCRVNRGLFIVVVLSHDAPFCFKFDPVILMSLRTDKIFPISLRCYNVNCISLFPCRYLSLNPLPFVQHKEIKSRKILQII